MNQQQIVIGIDTSAYTTSVAAVDRQGEVLFDCKTLLAVPAGMRGLRQSVAREQHNANLSQILGGIGNSISMEQVVAIAVSDRPRPVEGSYMPVFMDGVGAGADLALKLNVPLYYFSHQEGHIEAVKHFSSLDKSDRVLCFHLSGGTSELLLAENGSIQIIGGSKDLSFGQLIDRVGVRLGFDFPAGIKMDQLAHQKAVFTHWLKPIKSDGLRFNLSGIETQCQRRIEEGVVAGELIPELFQRVSNCLAEVADAAALQSGLDHIIFVGGVSGSLTIRENLGQKLKCVVPVYGTYSSDNAVGIALLGGKKKWQ